MPASDSVVRGPVVPWSRGPVDPWTRGPVGPWTRGPGARGPGARGPGACACGTCGSELQIGSKFFFALRADRGSL